MHDDDDDDDARDADCVVLPGLKVKKTKEEKGRVYNLTLLS